MHGRNSRHKPSFAAPSFASTRCPTDHSTAEEALPPPPPPLLLPPKSASPPSADRRAADAGSLVGTAVVKPPRTGSAHVGPHSSTRSRPSARSSSIAAKGGPLASAFARSSDKKSARRRAASAGGDLSLSCGGCFFLCYCWQMHPQRHPGWMD